MKNKRLYAPFVKVGKRWIRATQPDGTERFAYSKETAVRVYQSWLLAPSMDGVNEIRELRPVPRIKDNCADEFVY